MNQTVSIQLESDEELAVARWAEQHLDGYLENMQDDQHQCYECGVERDAHDLIPGEPEGDHAYDGTWPDFRTEITLNKRWIIALHPRMVIEHLLHNVFDDFEKMEKEDWDGRYWKRGNPGIFVKPEPEVATILRARIRLAMKAIGEPVPEV